MKNNSFKNIKIIMAAVLFALLFVNDAYAFKPMKPGDNAAAGPAVFKPGAHMTGEVSTGNTKIVPVSSAAKPMLPFGGTGEVSAEPKTAVNYQMPLNSSDSFETAIEKLTLKNEEVPETITLASVAKMKTNPHIATTSGDFSKISKDAFRSKVSSSNWRAVHSSFYMNKSGEDDTLYIIIAIECKKDISADVFKKEVSDLKRYMKRESSDEYVVLEKFPYWVVIASNQNGDYEFSIIKDLGEKMKIKLFGASAAVAPVPVTYDGNAKKVPEAVSGKDQLKQDNAVLDGKAAPVNDTKEAAVSKPAAAAGNEDAKNSGPKAEALSKEKQPSVNKTLKPKEAEAGNKGVIISEDKKDDKKEDSAKKENKKDVKKTEGNNASEPDEEITADDEE
ncbi:MAG: hypothetical protein QMC67_03665 [Candidatus Wallbacteria bacterium]